jgi:hypothetical protein
MAIEQSDIDAAFKLLEHIRRSDVDPATHRQQGDMLRSKQDLMVYAMGVIANCSTDPQAKRLASIATESLNFPRHRG